MKLRISWGWLLVILIFLIWMVRFRATDNSDVSWKQRSGLRIHVDALTGVNYFSTGGLFGIGCSLTVRVDTNGNPVVTKP